jgi:hypothetical protein
MLIHVLRTAAIGGIAVSLTCGAARAAATDALTGLPLYPGAPFTMKLPDWSYCGTPTAGTMYQPDGKVVAIDKWYAAHLPSFRVFHGFTDRTQDTFAKPDLTAAVTVTGVPGKTGDVYAVSYVRFAKPLTAAAMESMNKHEVVCK